MFFNDTDILIKKSNKDLNVFKLGKNIIYKDINSYSKEVVTKEIINGDYSFVDIHIDIDDYDRVYGILNDKKGKLLSINMDDDTHRDIILKYDYRDFCIKFPYIKDILNGKHIFYYLVDIENLYVSDLIHIYKDRDLFIKNKIDVVPHNIMSNYEVVWDEDIPIVFYFKYIDDAEELFVSVFNRNYNEWSKPLKITDSKKGKVYLSAIKDVSGYYNIVFSENNEGKYYCKYIKGELIYDKFEVLELQTIKTDLMCLFPHIINYRNELYIQWGEYNYVYTCKSSDLGRTWDTPKINNQESNMNFQRYIYKSNFIEDREYIFKNIFGDREYMNMLDYKINDNL